MAITPNTTFTAGNVLTADQMNRLPWGVIGVAQVTSPQTGITAVADVTGLTITWTASSSRIYKISFHILVQKVSAAGLVWLRLTDSSNVQKASSLQTLSAADYGQGSLVYYETGLSGSVTRKVRAEASAGSVTADAAANTPMVFMVEDIGQA